MSLFRRGKVWWYEFWFAGRRIQESAKTTSNSPGKTAVGNWSRATTASSDERIRSVREVAQDYLDDHVLRNQGQTFAQYALSHVARLLGPKMIVDIDEDTIRQYQTDRLREDAAPKTINEEIGFLLRLLGDRGDLIRLRLRKEIAETQGQHPCREGILSRGKEPACRGGTLSPLSDHLSGTNAGVERRLEER